MELLELRKEIDKLDSELLIVLNKRMALIKKIAKSKNKKELPITDQERETQILKEKKRLAKELNLNEEFVENLFNLILKESRRIQNSLHLTKSRNKPKAAKAAKK